MNRVRMLTATVGYNTTLTLRTHEGSVPSQPALGRALQRFEVEIPTPSLGGPREGDGNDDGKKGPHFIEDATVSSVLPLKVSIILGKSNTDKKNQRCISLPVQRPLHCFHP